MIEDPAVQAESIPVHSNSRSEKVKVVGMSVGVDPLGGYSIEKASVPQPKQLAAPSSEWCYALLYGWL
jgi:hypothetical protein